MRCVLAGLLTMLISTLVGVIGAFGAAVMFLVALNSNTGIVSLFRNRTTIVFLVILELCFFGMGFWWELRKEAEEQQQKEGRPNEG